MINTQRLKFKNKSHLAIHFWGAAKLAMNYGILNSTFYNKETGRMESMHPTIDKIQEDIEKTCRD